jgi:GYF domain 2
MNIFVNKNGHQQGPFTAEQVQHELKIGAFSATDYAWHEGLPDWIPLDSLFSPSSAPPVSALRVNINILATIIIALLVLFAGASVGYYYWVPSQTKLSDSCKRYLELYLIEAGKLASQVEQGATLFAFKDQLSMVTSAFQMVEETWPDHHHEIPECFEKSIEGYNLALRLWSDKLNKQHYEPTEPDINGWESYIDYAKDHGGKTSLKMKVWPANSYTPDTYHGKKYISYDNVGVFLGIATDYYKTGRTMLRSAKLKE